MFDPTKVDPDHADLFYHGYEGTDGEPVGLSDEEWDQQRATLEKYDAYPWAKS